MCWVNRVVPIPKIGPLCCKTGHDANMLRWFQQVVKPIEFRKGVVKMLGCSVQVIKSYIDCKFDLSARKRIVSAMENRHLLRIVASAEPGAQPKSSTFSSSFRWVKKGVVDRDRKF